MVGTDLIEVLIQNSGLPEDYVRQRLNTLIAEAGHSSSEVELEDIRELLSDLLLDLVRDSLQEPA